MTDLEAVQKLQEEIKAGNVAVGDFVKYSASPKQTYYKLKDDTVTPEKMTAKTVADLAILYKLLLPDESDNRDYKLGQVLAILDAIAPVSQDDLGKYTARPMSSYKVIFERLMATRIQRVNELEREHARVMDRITFEEFSDEPLQGKYFLGYQVEKLRLSRLKLA